MLDIAIQSGGLINQKAMDMAYKNIANAGIKCIDFNIIKREDYKDIDFNIFKKNLECAKANGLRFCQVHEPLWGRYIDLRIEEDFITEVLEISIKICKILESPYLVVHPYQFDDSVGEKEQRDLNINFFEKIGKIALEYGIMLCIENKPNSMGWGIAHSVCSEAEELVTYIMELNDKLGAECFGVCLDVGHSNLSRKNLKKEVIILGEHLKVLHIHDNDGIEDLHQIPFSFNRHSVDFSSFLAGLREINYRGVLSFETYNAMVSAPGMLHRAILSYLKEIGDLFNKVIFFEDELKQKSAGKDIILFGAGKMFDIYMKQFGAKYPPLFAIDNNDGLWGTQKQGIDIKRPALIKESKKPLVVLCNAYYEENILQLEEMGIDDYIYTEEIFRMRSKPFSSIW